MSDPCPSTCSSAPPRGGATSPSRPPRPRRALAAGAVALGAAVGAACLGRAMHDHERLLVVDPGVLLRSRLLSAERLEEVLRERGVRTVVNLQPATINALPWHAAEAEACWRAGAVLVDLPLEAETPPSPREVARFLAVCDDPARRPVLVHCQHGVVRTGMLVAAYQIARLGWSNERALREMPSFGHRLDRPGRAPVRAFVRAVSGPAPEAVREEAATWLAPLLLGAGGGEGGAAADASTP